MGNNIAHGPFFGPIFFNFIVIKICPILCLAVNIILWSDKFDKCNFQMWLSLKKKISILKRSFKLTPGFVICVSTKIGLL